MKPLKGRHWVLLWLLIFLGGAVAVVARQTAALQTARRLHDLRQERRQPRSPPRRARASYPSWPPAARSWSPRRSAPFGLHEPADSEFVLFPVPRRPRRERPPDGPSAGPHRRHSVRLRAGRPRYSRASSAAPADAGRPVGRTGPAPANRTHHPSRPSRRPVRPQRGATRSQPGVLPRRRGSERARRCAEPSNC